MQKNFLLTLAFLPGMSLATVSLNGVDGYYNITETEFNAGVAVYHNEWEGTKNIIFNSPETNAFQFRYNAADKTADFNNGGTNNWEYWHDLTHGLWLGADNTGNFWTNTSVGLDTYPTDLGESWSSDATYTQMANLLLLSGTDTDIEDGETLVESFSRVPVMFTDDAELSINAELWVDSESFQIAAGQYGNTDIVNVDETFAGTDFELGLKAGSADLTPAHINGPYHFARKGFYNACADVDINDNCVESVQEGWMDIATIDFTGDGNCSVSLYVYNDFAIQRMLSSLSSITIPNLYVDSAEISSLFTCGYSVADVDKLQLILNYDAEGDEVFNFIVSAGHRYLAGSDQFTTTPLSSGDFERGTIFGMRQDTTPTVEEISGTYLGHYQGIVYDNTDDTETDRTVIKYTNRNFALTFDGLGGCTYKEYKNVATRHYYPLTDTGKITTADIEYETTCSSGYFIETDSNFPTHKFIRVWIAPDFSFKAYLSDNGETLSFFKPVAKDLATNNGTNGIPAADYAATATILKQLSGIAIKYAGDAASTDAAVRAWLNVPLTNNVPMLYLLLL